MLRSMLRVARLQRMINIHHHIFMFTRDIHPHSSTHDWVDVPCLAAGFHNRLLIPLVMIQFWAAKKNLNPQLVSINTSVFKILTH